ncbi:MAG: BrxE family protein [Deltaproteobacteria bacterium]|nr:BrxE family protein [Deltaproteobacteria bacterium]
MPLDLDHLLRLRLAVARFGEMDAAQWWNTKGVLGRLGAMAWPRNFPRTHAFARARTVFTVARARCDEVFNPPGCITLWKLPTEVEDAFETRWQEWLDEPAPWLPFFDRINAAPTGELIPYLTDLGLTGAHADRFGTLRRSPDGRGVPLPGVATLDEASLTLLAAGFGRGGPRDLVVPYARVDE